MMTNHIHYVTAGDRANPPIVFVHGLCWTNKIWEPVVQGLKNSYYLILIDLPGHGNSKTLDHYSFEEVSREIHELIASLCLSSKVCLAGSSIGASVALVYTSLYPNVKNLILVDGGYYPFSKTEGLSWSDIEDGTMPDHIFESQSSFIEFMKGDNPSLWNPSIEQAVLDQIVWNDAERKYQYKINDDGQLGYMKAEWELNPEEIAPGIPEEVDITLMIALNENTDIEFLLDYASRMKAIHPFTDIVIFEDTDHLIMLDDETRFVREVKRALGGAGQK
ncbi:alpha/beta hydrolase [Cytobacillus firmus]|uniref:alpha/beta hydrolase n=1 Tax=Cytobacillus firmus TaxID=1399 RepID=UPI00384F9171